MARWTVCLLAAAAGACGPTDTETRGGEIPGSVARQFTTDQFQTLRWLEGRWRGSENNANPFWETYEFVNDSTIRIRSYADARFSRVNDSTELQLSAGMIELGGPVRWQVQTLDSQSVRFIPLGDAPNTVTWLRGTDTSWTVVLNGLAEGEGDPDEKAYQMVRVSP